MHRLTTAFTGMLTAIVVVGIMGYFVRPFAGRFALGVLVTLAFMFFLVGLHVGFTKLFRVPPAANQLRQFVFDWVILFVLTLAMHKGLAVPFDTSGAYWPGVALLLSAYLVAAAGYTLYAVGYQHQDALEDALGGY